MRTALTIGICHGGKRMEVIASSLVPIQNQKDDLKKLLVEKSHPDFERVELWESDLGRVKSKTFTKAEKPKK